MRGFYQLMPHAQLIARRISPSLRQRLGPSAALLLALQAGLAAGLAQTTGPAGLDLANLTFEQLAEIQIITTSKRPESLFSIPAAVRVVTGEDLHRSGATRLAEALRAVPGLNVAQINSGAWAIAARGLQTEFSTKLLVLRDGRSVYTAVQGGVFWDVQDYPLEDLERIEVVLGPGGSIWGANAMNGVINILTKSAEDTQGGLAYAGSGNEKLAIAGGRYGWRLNERTFGRVYVKYSATDDTRTATGEAGDDAMQFGQAGFRLDGSSGAKAHWTLQGDLYRGTQETRQDLPALSHPPTYLKRSEQDVMSSGANLLGRWEAELGPDSTLRLQTFADHTRRNSAQGTTLIQTVDIDAQHTWNGWSHQQIDWGVNGRLVRDEAGDALAIFDPLNYTARLFSVFAQDQAWLIPDRVALTAGIKVEHNEYTGWEPQPSVRVTWQPVTDHTLWTGWSRAVHPPTRTESDVIFDVAVIPPGPASPLPALVRVIGTPGLQAETMDAFELGWRWQASGRLSAEVSVFNYEYNRLLMAAEGSTRVQFTPIPAILVEYPFANGMAGHTRGGELVVHWQPGDRWQIQAAYCVTEMEIRAYRSDPLGQTGAEGRTPRQTASLQTRLNLHRDWDFDATWRYVDQLPQFAIKSYVELDLRLAWRPTKTLEIAVVGQNLLHARHAEYQSSVPGRQSEIQRGVYIRLTWRFE